MLKVENLSYKYKNSDPEALKNLNAHFEAGKINAILGPSGSGKTALLSILAGLEVPTQGTIYIEGDNLANLDLNLYRRERVAMVLQAFHLFPLLTALENACYPMEQRGIEKSAANRKAAELLDGLGITEDKHKHYPADLSSGEQQRVAIARALSTGARVILADEPTGSLDEPNGDAVMAILRHLAHRQNYCIIVVTHNPNIARASDVVYRLSGGAIRKSM